MFWLLGTYFGFQQKFSYSPCILEFFRLNTEFNIPNRRFDPWISLSR